MSKKKRRNSRRRKSSSSSKQSISPSTFQKNTKSPIDDSVCEDGFAEKGVADSFRKENVLSKSEEEEEKDTPMKEGRFRMGGYGESFQETEKKSGSSEQETTDKGLKITTSVTINDVEQSTSRVVFQRSHELGADGTTNSVVAVTTAKFKGIPSNMKVEIKEEVQLDNSDFKTTFVLHSGKGKCTEAFVHSQCEGSHIPNNETFSREYTWSPDAEHSGVRKKGPCENMSYEFSIVELRCGDAGGLSKCYEDISCSKCSRGHHVYRYGSFDHSDTDFTLVDASSNTSTDSDLWLPKKETPYNRYCSEVLDIPPPREFADEENGDVEELREDVASCQISAPDEFRDEPEVMCDFTRAKPDPECRSPVNGHDTVNVSACLGPQSEFDAEDVLFMGSRTPMSRSSFTKNFIYSHKRKTCQRNNSIAILETNNPRTGYFTIPPKRRKTFPGVAHQSQYNPDSMSLYRESFSSGTLSSFFMQSLPLQAERSDRFYLEDERLYPFYTESRKSSSSSYKPSTSPILSNLYAYSRTRNPFYPSKLEEIPDEVYVRDRLCLGQREASDDTVVYEMDLMREMQLDDRTDQDSITAALMDQSEVTESGFDEEMVEMEETCPEKAFRRDLLIQITPPSPGASQEQITEDNYNAKPDSQRRKIRSSVVTTIIGGCEQKFVKSDTQSDEETYEENLLDTNSMVLDCQAIDMAEDIETVVEDPLSHQCPPIGGLRNTSQPDPPIATEATAFQGDSNSFELGDISPQGCKGVLESGGESMDLRPTCSNTDSEDKGCTTTPQKTNLYHTDCAEKHSSSKTSLEVKEHLKPPADPVFKDPEDSSDHWAKRRKQFKDTKQWSSAGGSSITSNITDESDTMNSEETRSVDISVRDIEDRGFYTETFHAASWIFCGDGSNSSQTPRGLSKRPRPVTIRDRTVKICKGMGDYPWGFRIQFSKPIVVTEVDTNGAAEEAGLLVGDYVQAVNGTDVTSVPHSEAADLARQGPDLLTLTIGSDISRCPNTPRPACRGYLHKRTQYSLIKGWRKRWFVLKHDCCLHYYRHKRDEGKSRSLSIVKLEGAEVGPDTSLGKPFVFKCAPVSGGRVFYFCATSNQEMKRWLEALNCAVHPITQNHVWVDVTRHNASLPPLAIKTPDCLGLLHQLDRNKDTWVQHYCILKDGCLYFYPSIRSTHALGGIYLHGYMVREQPQGSKRSTIELRPPSEEFKTFYLCAENATENKRWILAMKASLSKWVPLHQAIQDFIRRPAEETKM